MTSQNHEEHKTCFVAMPITTPISYIEKYGDQDHFAHVLDHLFRPALQELGFTVISPSVLGAELVHAEIIKNLEQADLVLCDLSSLNPNVFFELGIRTSLDRPLVLVKDDLTLQIPFDLNAISTLTYDGSLTPWSLVKEIPRLMDQIKGTVDSPTQGSAMWRYFGLTKRASPSESGTVEAKLDLIIGEITRSQLSTAAESRARVAPENETIDPIPNHMIAVILASDGIRSFTSKDEKGTKIIRVSSALTDNTKMRINDLANKEGQKIIIESPTEALKFHVFSSDLHSSLT